jgi:hypothetical protein
MKFLITLWKILPLYVIFFSPVQRHLKLSQVFGTLSLNNSIVTLFFSESPIFISKNTTGFFGSFSVGGGIGPVDSLSLYKLCPNKPFENFFLDVFVSFCLFSINCLI